MNNITRIINEVSNTIRKDEFINDKIAIDLQNRIRLIKEELVNVKYAMEWAKQGVINTILLNKIEIELAVKELKDERMPFASTEEALEYAEVNVMYNNTMILYMVKIPLTNEKAYENYIVRPVKRSKKIINITFKEIFKNNNDIYAIRSKCNKYNNLRICNKNNLLNLSNDTCLPNILKSLASHCNFSNSQHVPQIEEIHPGLILLNDFDGTIKIKNSVQQLNGTFLIKFANATVTIGNQIYQNLEAPPFEVIPASLQPTPIEKNWENLLTLQSLNELHINNTRQIRLLKICTITSETSMISIIVISGIIALLIRQRKSSKKLILNGTTTIEPIIHSIASSTPTTTLPQENINYNTKFNDLPYF